MSQVANFSRHDALLNKLHEMRDCGGPAITRGLSDEVILDFLRERDDLALAIDRAYEAFMGFKKTHPDFLTLEEGEQIHKAHAGLTNFYARDAVNPFVAVGGAGPWLITLKGAVVYDVGGYGMLGFGHTPQAVLDAMNQTHVMANVMTASVQMIDFVDALRREIGHTREEGMPFESLLCLNSGSELMSAAARITDIHTKKLTDPGGRYEGRKVCGLTL